MTSEAGGETSTMGENPFPLVMVENPLLRQTMQAYEGLLTSITSPNNGSVQKPGKFFSNIKHTFSNQQVVSGSDFVGGIVANLANLNIGKLPSGTTFSQLTSNRRQFEEESKKYYDFLSKWLAQGYGTSPADCPSQDKLNRLFKRERAWHLARVSYFNWLYNEVIQLYLAQKLVKNDTYVKINRYFVESNTRRNDFIFSMQSCSTFTQLQTLVDALSTLEVYDSELSLVSQNAHLLSCVSGISLVRDAATGKLIRAAGASLSGLIFTQHGQKKPGWHKQWICVRKGTFYEFIDWRSCRTLRNEGLSLGLCNLKLVDGSSPVGSRPDVNGPDAVGSRKNVFRIMSNMGIEHIFQTNSSVEIKSWLNCVELDSRYSTRPSHNTRMRSMTSATLSSNASTESPVGPRSRRVSSVTSTLLKKVQKCSRSNLRCCDCGAEGPDWVSINLLVVFCIKCSASHRALGSSISKVRSLTLDTFKSEVRLLLEKGINNSASNNIWEAKMDDSERINNETSAEMRNDFIKHKYVVKKWLADGPVDLHSAIQAHEYYKIIEALTKRGNDSVSLDYSLAYPTLDSKGQKLYDISELLVLNGVVLTTVSPDTLDPDASAWLQGKLERLNGTKPCEYTNRPNLTNIVTTRVDSKKLRSPKEGFNKFRKRMLG